jgi:thioesterase domain-containing protein
LRELARHLSPEDSFFVFQDPAFDEPDAGKDSIEAMALDYVECMQQKQPAGPYLLGGWSVGGLIAFEMARQLRAQNQTVTLLALVDSYPPAASMRSREGDDAVLFKSFLLNNGFLPHHIKQIRKHSRTLEQALRYALQVGTKANLLPPELPAEAIRRFFSIYRRYVLAGRGFKLPSVDLTAHLWRAAESRKSGDAQEARWKVAVRKLHLHDVPGDHFSILRQPHVAILAAQLSSEIRHANARVSQNKWQH